MSIEWQILVGGSYMSQEDVKVKMDADWEQLKKDDPKLARELEAKAKFRKKLWESQL